MIFPPNFMRCEGREWEDLCVSCLRQATPEVMDFHLWLSPPIHDGKCEKFLQHPEKEAEK